MRRPLLLLAVFVCLLAVPASALAGGRLYAGAYGSGPPELIGGFDRLADGSLAPLPGSPFAAYAGPPYPVAGLFALGFTPDGDRAVSGYLFKGGVAGHAVDAAGAVTSAGAPVPTASATGLAVAPDGRFAYAATREFSGVKAEGIRGFAIAADGSAFPLAPPYGSGEYGDLALSPDGRFLFAVKANQVERFAVAAGGGLTSLGTTPAAGAQILNPSPDGRFLYVGFGGPPAGVAPYAIGADGALSPLGGPAVTGDSGIDFFAVAPDGGHLYVPAANLGAIVTAAVAGDGSLAVVGSTPATRPEAVEVTPDGRFLYWFQADGTRALRLASIGADGGLAPLPATTPWDAGEPMRILFQPRPAPVASFTAVAAAPGEPTGFDATASARAARYYWDFGDGTVLADGGPVPTHVYAGAGVYQVRLSVTDPGGCSAARIYTGQSTSCPGGTETTSVVSVDTPPALSALRAAPRKFAAAGRGKKGAKTSRARKVGTAFRYRLSEPAIVRFKIEKRLPGRLVGGKCRRKTAKNAKRKACPIFRKLGSRAANGGAGANKSRFSGRLRGRKLSPGGYRVTAVATDPAGGRSLPRSAGFRVRRG